MSLGQALKELRKYRAWTQKDLAKRTGLGRGYIAQLEVNFVAKPSAETFLKLAKAFNIRPEKLYQAAGYIRGGEVILQHEENPEEILEKLKLVQPISIPVYTEFPFHAGEPIEPVEYIYRARHKYSPPNIEAYVVKGHCLEPIIKDKDIIVIDRDADKGHGKGSQGESSRYWQENTEGNTQVFIDEEG